MREISPEALGLTGAAMRRRGRRSVDRMGLLSQVLRAEGAGEEMIEDDRDLYQKVTGGGMRK